MFAFDPRKTNKNKTSAFQPAKKKGYVNSSSIQIQKISRNKQPFLWNQFDKFRVIDSTAGRNRLLDKSRLKRMASEHRFMSRGPLDCVGASGHVQSWLGVDFVGCDKLLKYKDCCLDISVEWLILWKQISCVCKMNV